jgi:hypothetical protein
MQALRPPSLEYQPLFKQLFVIWLKKTFCILWWWWGWHNDWFNEVPDGRVIQPNVNSRIFDIAAITNASFHSCYLDVALWGTVKAALCYHSKCYHLFYVINSTKTVRRHSNNTWHFFRTFSTPLSLCEIWCHFYFPSPSPLCDVTLAFVNIY